MKHFSFLFALENRLCLNAKTCSNSGKFLPMPLNIRCGHIVRDFEIKAITKDGFKGNDFLIS
jgi:hypothetical protein